MDHEVLKRKYEIFTGVWKFYKKWAEKLPLDDMQWNQINQDAEALMEKYREDVLTKEIILAAVMDMDIEDRRERRESLHSE
ncbi:MAG: hypothetical protein ACOYBL_06280 [Lachnospiraceae bacterium]|jgi:hypothetical protein